MIDNNNTIFSGILRVRIEAQAQNRMGRSEDYHNAIAFALIDIAQTLREIRNRLDDEIYIVTRD